MKKPFFYAFGAATYIAALVSIFSTFIERLPQKSIFIPMTMLSLFVLSAAIMGFLFLSEPLSLYFENKKKDAIMFFGKIVGYFACFVVLFLVLLIFV